MADASPEQTGLHDGRFGDQFDDEVSVAGVLWTTALLAFLCALGMAITWVMQGYYADRAEAATPPPSPVAAANEVRRPEGPLLQRSPEGELEALQHEMSERLNGYGWVDEATGVVHLPIDQAMDLLLERGISTGFGDSAAAPAAGASPAEEGGE